MERWVWLGFSVWPFHELQMTKGFIWWNTMFASFIYYRVTNKLTSFRIGSVSHDDTFGITVDILIHFVTDFHLFSILTLKRFQNFFRDFLVSYWDMSVSFTGSFLLVATSMTFFWYSHPLVYSFWLLGTDIIFISHFDVAFLSHISPLRTYCII